MYKTTNSMITVDCKFSRKVDIIHLRNHDFTVGIYDRAHGVYVIAHCKLEHLVEIQEAIQEIIDNV